MLCSDYNIHIYIYIERNIMRQKEQNKSYYEERGSIRQMVILSQDHCSRLKSLAKQYKLNTGEVMEVLLDNANFEALNSKFVEKHASKRDGRTIKSELLKKLKEMSPEQLEAIMKGNQ